MLKIADDRVLPVLSQILTEGDNELSVGVVCVSITDQDRWHESKTGKVKILLKVLGGRVSSGQVSFTDHSTITFPIETIRVGFTGGCIAVIIELFKTAITLYLDIPTNPQFNPHEDAAEEMKKHHSSHPRMKKEDVNRWIHRWYSVFE